MDTIVTAVILSFSTNIDNLAVGMTYGIRKFAIRFPANLLIACLSGLSTFASMLVGDWLEGFLPGDWAKGLGSSILMAIGLLSLVEAISKKEKLGHGDREIESLSLPNPSLLNASVPNSNGRIMSLKRAGILGLALTMSNWGTGIGAGIARLDLGLTSGCSFLSSLLTIGGGALLGKWAIQYFRSDRLTWIAGLLLIGLGIYEGF